MNHVDKIVSNQGLLVNAVTRISEMAKMIFLRSIRFNHGFSERNAMTA